MGGCCVETGWGAAPQRPVEALLAGFTLSGLSGSLMADGVLGWVAHTLAVRGFQWCRGLPLGGSRADFRPLNSCIILTWCIGVSLHLSDMYHLQGVASLGASAPLGASASVVFSSVRGAGGPEREWAVTCARNVAEGTVGFQKRAGCVLHPGKRRIAANI